MWVVWQAASSEHERGGETAIERMWGRERERESEKDGYVRD